MPPLAYHYTFEAALTPILNEGGTLRPVPGNFAPGERPILWFSSASPWEPSAARSCMDANTGERRAATVEEMRGRFGWPIRFGWPAERLLSWSDLRAQAGLSEARWNGLESTARALGADPSQWLGSFDPIQMVDCPVSEAMNPEGAWVPLQDLFDLRMSGAIPPPCG